MSGIHGHAFLELCCSSDSELTAVVVDLWQSESRLLKTFSW